MNRFESLAHSRLHGGKSLHCNRRHGAAAGATLKGDAVLATTTVTATVVKIDQKTRAVTLKAADGQEYSFVADEAVKNLAQVKKGDVVTATYTEALAYEVKKGGAAGAVATAGGGTAKPGAKPAAAPRANSHGGRRRSPRSTRRRRR